jgi:hypothetical protein
MKKVYLSGGTVSGWQDVVEHNINPPPKDTVINGIHILSSSLYKAEFYNPAKFRVGSVDRPDVRMYGPMDRIKIEECDVLFAYLEAGNPTPINVALELGYAKGLGKLTILCNEWTEAKWKAGQLGCQRTTDPGNNDATWYKYWYVDLLNSWTDFQESDFGLAMELLKQVLEYE